MEEGEDETEISGDTWSIRWDPGEWRVQLLNLCIRYSFYFGVLVYIPSVALGYQLQMWALICLDTLAMLSMTLLFFLRGLPSRVRTFTFLLTLYALAMGMLVWVLPVSGVFMMGYSVFATLLLSRNASYVALLFNFLGMMAVGVFVAAGDLSFGYELTAPTAGWTVITANYMLINALIVIAIGAVVNTLEKAWLSEKQALVDAEDSEKRFLQIAKNIQEIFYIQDAKTGALIYTSPLFEKVWETPPNNVKTWGDIEALIYKEDVKSCREQFEKRRRGTSNELEFRVGNGSNQIWIRDRGYPVREGEQITHIVGTMREFTEEKRLQESVLRTQRLESIGTLASGIAHDLNNVLSPILMSVDVLKNRVKDPDLRGTLEALESSAKRGAGLVRQILGTGRGASAVKPISPVKVVQDVRKIVQETFPNDLELKWEIQEDLWNVVCDEVHLEQIVMNLLVNARDAVSGKGSIELTLRNSVSPEGEFVEIRVKDTGTGIPVELQEKIFEPFFSTKEVGKGTGLGLSTTYSVVRQMGGQIEVDSKPGEGALFSVKLPATRVKAEMSSDDLHVGLRGRGELVLLVDDDEQIITVTKGILEEFGYAVVTAKNGALGVSEYVKNRESIAVVVSDMNMPVMNGTAMVRAIKALNPDARVIGMTGVQDSESDPGECHRFLMKPFSTHLLLANVRELIDEMSETPAAPIELPARAMSDQLNTTTTARRILVVEDELILGQMTEQALERAGHTVTWVKDGQAALEEIELGEFDVVISDINLPRLNGAQLFDAVRVSRPELKFIFTTGDHQLPESLRPHLGNGVEAIYKPFTLKDLSSAILTLS